MPLIDDMLADLLHYKEELVPRLEGFRDDTRVGLTKSALVIAHKAVTLYQGQLTTVEAAIAALTTLQQQQYPALPRFSMPKADRVNFADQRRTISLADDQLDAEEEVESGTIVFTPGPVPVPT